MFSLDCTVKGEAGDGTRRGDCDEHQVCLKNGTCAKRMCRENKIG